MVVWLDEFTTFSGATDPDYVNNGRWGDSIYRWGFTRTLSGNGDLQYWVTDGNDFGGGTMASALVADGGWGSAPFLHVQAGSTLRLRAYPVSQAQSDAKIFGYRYIAGSLVDCAPPLATSGQAFGTWSVRFRFNAFGQGQHLAIWLLPDDGAWPPEIDILEVVNGQSTWHAALHTVGGGGDFLLDYNRPGNETDWYIASLAMNQESISWRINGTEVKKVPYNTSYLGSVKRWYILITWEIGTGWTGPPDGTTPWPADVEIDYIVLDGAPMVSAYGGGGGAGVLGAGFTGPSQPWRHNDYYEKIDDEWTITPKRKKLVFRSRDGWGRSGHR